MLPLTVLPTARPTLQKSPNLEDEAKDDSITADASAKSNLSNALVVSPIIICQSNVTATKAADSTTKTKVALPISLLSKKSCDDTASLNEKQ